jgi:hypothetical protein
VALSDSNVISNKKGWEGGGGMYRASEMRNSYNISIGKSQYREQLGTSWRRRKGCIKTVLREAGSEVWTALSWVSI